MKILETSSGRWTLNCTGYSKYTMRLFLLLVLCTFYAVGFSQTTKDTTFSVRGFICECKLAIDGKPDVKPFDLNEKPAQYPGGSNEWEKFVKKNIDKKLKGKDAVEVHFEVDAYGQLSGLRLLNRAPNQKYEEVVRILRLSGTWFPAIQNGFCIKSVKRLTLEF